MRYRMEVIENELVIRNVEADIKLGFAIPFWKGAPHDPDRAILAGCHVLHKDAGKIATISTRTVPNPLEQAPVVVATCEAYYGYPGLKDCAKRPDPHRIEWLLGTVLADAVSAIARACIEYSNGGLKAETKSKCAELIAQLHAIWYASRFGSYDGERQTIDPYFIKGLSSRISFAEAAQHYGIFELSLRFPDESETSLKAALSLPLELLSDTLTRQSPPQSATETQSMAT